MYKNYFGQGKCDFLVILDSYSVWMLFVGLFFSPNGNDDFGAMQMHPIFVCKLPFVLWRWRTWDPLMLKRLRKLCSLRNKLYQLLFFHMVQVSCTNFICIRANTDLIVGVLVLTWRYVRVYIFCVDLYRRSTLGSIAFLIWVCFLNEEIKRVIMTGCHLCLYGPSMDSCQWK